MQEPKDDLVSQLVTEQVKPGNLDKADAVQMAFLLLVAGNATMVNMMALVSAVPDSETRECCRIGRGRLQPTTTGC